MHTTRSLALLLAIPLFGLVLLAVSPPSAQAKFAVLHVTVDGSTSNPACGGSWDTPCGLQYALTSVASAGVELWVAAGTYTPTTSNPDPRTATFQLRNDIAVYGGFAMTETMRSERNPAANVTILSGDIGMSGIVTDNVYSVVTGSGVANSAVLDGFSVTGGNANIYGTPGDRGAGMYNSGGSPTVANVIFINNSAGNRAGGMYNHNYSSPRLTNVAFISNTANWGAGMYNESFSSPTLTNTTFISNAASDSGGGMYNYNTSNAQLTNVTFSGNSAPSTMMFRGAGGGMVNYGSSPTLTNTTFVSNTAGNSGGGMHNMSNSPATIRNAIFWGNTALSGSQISNDASTPTVSYSVVQGGYAGGTNILTADPRLGVLGNYGGSTQTVPLLPGSSAVDAGNDATCAAIDQRGIARPQGAHCDMGAFESQGYTLTKSSGDGQSTPIYTPFANSLAATLTEMGSALPLAGVTITFTAPSSGASAAWSGSLVVTATTNASGAATVAPPTANGTVGAYAVTASIAGATAPVAFPLTNAKANTTTTLASSLNPSRVGQTIVLTATVSGLSPSGSVAFADGGVTLATCGSVALSGGSAACTLSSLTVGAHAMTATFSGDATNAASTSLPYTQTVGLADNYLPMLKK